jgi:hypothetical protein
MKPISPAELTNATISPPTVGGRKEAARASKTLLIALATCGALVALWAPAYLSLLDRFGLKFPPRSEFLEWSLVVFGALGLASVLYLAWHDSRDRIWRARRGLPHV